MKKDLNFSNHLIIILSITVLLTACNPINVNQEPTTTPIPSATSTVTPSPSLTPIPQYTDVPNHYDQNDNSAEFIPLISIKDAKNLSREDILTKLVTLLLEYFKTRSQTSRAVIKDYKDVYVYKVINDNNNADNFFDIVAFVKFSIIPAEIPNNWASLTIGTTEPNDPWWLVGTVFGYFRDGEYFRLRMMPGWGT